MSDILYAAFGRALSHVSERAALPLMEPILAQTAWELKGILGGQCLDLAFVIKPREGSVLVGRSGAARSLPTATIVGLLVEANGDGAAIKIKDHAIDSARLVTVGCRSSVLVRLSLPDSAVQGGDAWVWFGLICAASPSHIELAKSVARSFSEWLTAHYGTVCAIERAKAETFESSRRLREASAVAHDVRAPLGAMGLLVSDDEISSGDRELLRGQFSYLEALLERLSPQSIAGVPASAEEIDACVVVRRVAARYGAGVSLSIPDQAVRSRMSELDLERVLTNLTGNAIQHSGGGTVELAIEQRSGALGVLISVKDSGPGFSAEILEQLAAGAPERVTSSTGWGLGLAASRRMVERSGGTLRLLQAEGGGGLVEVCLPRAHTAVVCAQVKKSGQQGASVEKIRCGAGQQALCIIDDDLEQAESLARVLASRGIEARCCSTVSDAITHMEGAEGFFLCDATMPDGGAQRLLELLQRKNLKRRVCVMSGVSDDEQLYRLAALGAESFLLKPVECTDIEKWIARVIRTS